MGTFRVALLLGILIGSAGTSAVFVIVDTYTSVTTRLSAVEGYIRGLDQFIRAGAR